MENEKQKENKISKTVISLLKIGAIISLIFSSIISLITTIGFLLYIGNYASIQNILVDSIIQSDVAVETVNVELLVDAFVFTSSALIILLSLLSIVVSYKILHSYTKIKTREEFSKKIFILILIAILYAFATPWLISSILVVSAVILNETNGVNKQDKISKKIQLLNDSLEEGEISEVHYKEELEKLINKY